MTDQEIIAEAAIRSLVIRERFYRDSCQWQKLRDCYHPNDSKTMIDITWYQGDIEGFVEGSRKMSKAGSNAIHNITPVEVSLKGSKGFSISVGNIVTRFTKEGSEYELVSNCRFLSRVERIASESRSWKMLSMEVIYINDKISPVFPSLESKGISIEGMEAFPRKSYKFLAYCLAEKGYQVKQDLPGVDDERLVEEVLNRNLAWLEA